MRRRTSVRPSPRPIGGHVGRRGGASADTCARPGGPSSFSLNAADMVSVCAQGSESGRRDARPLPRAGEPRRGVALRDPGRALGGGGTWNTAPGERFSRSRGGPCRAPGPRVRSGGELPGSRVGDGGAAAGNWVRLDPCVHLPNIKGIVGGQRVSRMGKGKPRRLYGGLQDILAEKNAGY